MENTIINELRTVVKAIIYTQKTVNLYYNNRLNEVISGLFDKCLLCKRNMDLHGFSESVKDIKRKVELTANRIAKKEGYGAATDIIFTEDEEKVVSATHCGYRKYTTGEYVSNAYRAKFGWKNTYYQHAKVKVSVNINNIY